MPQISDFIKRFNGLGLELLYNYIINWLGVLLPFTKFPIIKQILGSFIKARLVQLKEQVQSAEFHLIHNIIVTEQVNNYIKQVENNLLIQSNGSDEEKIKSQKELIEAARLLIRIRLP